MHVLHDKKIQSIELTGVIHLHDMGIGYCCCGTGLAMETFHELVALWALCQLRVHDLNGDGTSQTLVNSLIHRGHAAIGDSADDSVPASMTWPRGHAGLHSWLIGTIPSSKNVSRQRCVHL